MKSPPTFRPIDIGEIGCATCGQTFAAHGTRRGKVRHHISFFLFRLRGRLYGGGKMALWGHRRWDYSPRLATTREAALAAINFEPDADGVR